MMKSPATWLGLALAFALSLGSADVAAGSWSNTFTLAAVVTDSDGGLRYAEITSDGPCTNGPRVLWMSPSVGVEGKKAVLAALLTAMAADKKIQYYGECDSDKVNRVTFVRIAN